MTAGRPDPRTEVGCVGERGAALLYALVLTGVISLVIAALLSQSSVQFRAADAHRDRRDATFAADAGLEHALSTIGLVAAPPTSGSTCTDATRCPTAPVLDAQAQATGSGTATASMALPRGAGTNRLVVVATGVVGSGRVASVTVDGAPMHRAVRRSSTACWLLGCWGTATELWYALDAELPVAPGAHLLVATLAGGAPNALAVHASAWAGVLQDLGGVAHVPTATGTHLEQKVNQISTSITSTADGTLLLSSAAHADDDVNGCATSDALTGSGAGTRLTNGPHPSCAAGLGTSWSSEPAGTRVVTETFATKSSANAHVLVAFRPASSAVGATPVFGAACIDTPIHLVAVNGFTVDVVCAMPAANELTITSTAIGGGRTVVGRAALTRRPDGRVEVTSWDLRPDASTS